MVEPSAVNREVVGPSPTRGANKNRQLGGFYLLTLFFTFDTISIYIDIL